MRVDEFQDISPLRAHFVRAFQSAAARATIFAVGDDFQSIYRFAGSQIRIMTDFGHYFGHHRRLPLSLTHRFSAALADASGHFVLKNPGQLRKTVRGGPSDVERPITLIRTDEASATAGFRRALEIAQADAGARGRQSSVLLLGRYRSDEPATLTDLQRKHPELALSFSTVHRAKGAEADVVILLNVKGGTRGFPSGVQDDPLMRLILGESDHYPDAEERRLFYVALTRARRRAVVVANEDPDSVFTRELCDAEYSRWVEVVDLRAESQQPTCPGCRGGHLVPRSGPHGAFLGCTNFPHCLHSSRSELLSGRPASAPVPSTPASRGGSPGDTFDPSGRRIPDQGAGDSQAASRTSFLPNRGPSESACANDRSDGPHCHRLP